MPGRRIGWMRRLFFEKVRSCKGVRLSLNNARGGRRTGSIDKKAKKVES